MIDELSFEFYCKPESLFKQGFLDMLEETADYEKCTSAQVVLPSLNRKIKQMFFHANLDFNVRNNYLEQLNKQYKHFSDSESIQLHFKNICDFLNKKAEFFNIPISFINHMAFTVALKQSDLTDWNGNTVLIKDKMVDWKKYVNN